MPKKFKHFTLEFPGEEHVPHTYNLEDDPELCTDHKQLSIGQRLYILDTTVIDNSTNNYAKIPVECIYVEQDPNYPRALWYYFRAVRDEDQDMNQFPDPKFSVLYYKILESTSPYIIIV